MLGDVLHDDNKKSDKQNKHNVKNKRILIIPELILHITFELTGLFIQSAAKRNGV